MEQLFTNYDEFCEEVYKQFKYDLKGGEGEYRIIGYMISVAVQKAFAEQVAKHELAQEKIHHSILQFDEIGTGTKKGMMASVKLLSETLDSQYKNIKDLKNDVHIELKEKMALEMSNIASHVLRDALSKNGLSLNQQLMETIKDLNAASVDAVKHSEMVAQRVKKALSRTTLRLFLLPLLGTFSGIILLLILQSCGIITLPVQINLDARSFAEQVLSHLH